MTRCVVDFQAIQEFCSLRLLNYLIDPRVWFIPPNLVYQPKSSIHSFKSYWLIAEVNSVLLLFIGLRPDYILQSIYGFRGAASSLIFDDFAQSYARHIALVQNYRSTESILALGRYACPTLHLPVSYSIQYPLYISIVPSSTHLSTPSFVLLSLIFLVASSLPSYRKHSGPGEVCLPPSFTSLCYVLYSIPRISRRLLTTALQRAFWLLGGTPTYPPSTSFAMLFWPCGEVVLGLLPRPTSPFLTRHTLPLGRRLSSIPTPPSGNMSFLETRPHPPPPLFFLFLCSHPIRMQRVRDRITRSLTNTQGMCR